MRINKTSRHYINAMTSSVRLKATIEEVKAVNPVDKIQALPESSNSKVLSKDSFYDKLEEKENKLKKENFDKKEGSKSLEEVSQKDRQTLDFLYSMFEKFNKSMDNIKKIDIARNQDNFKKIKHTIDENSRFLASLGIMNDKLSHFYINEQTFVREIMKSPQKIKQLLEPQTGVIRKICDSFGKMLI